MSESQKKPLRECWDTHEYGLIKHRNLIGTASHVVHYREVSPELDAAVEHMREAIRKFGDIPMRGTYESDELKCHMKLFQAAEEYDKAKDIT